MQVRPGCLRQHVQRRTHVRSHQAVEEVAQEGRRCPEEVEHILTTGMGILRPKHDDLPLLVRVSDEHDVTSKLTISITLGDEHCSFSRFIIVFE